MHLTKRNKMNQIRKTKLIFLHIALISAVLCGKTYAQDKKEEPKPEAPKSVLAEEIEVVRPYKPVLANASKIRRNPDLNESPTYKPTLTYSILNKKLELNTDIRQLQYQQLETPKISELNNSLIKAGLGSFKTGIGEFYLNNGRDQAMQTGFFAKHFAQSGAIKRQEFSEQHLGAFLKSVGKNTSFSTQANYKGFGTYFYGADPLALPSVLSDPEKQRLSVIQLIADLGSTYDSNPEGINYGLKLDANLFKNSTSAKENSIVVSGMATKKWRAFNFGLRSSLDLTTVNLESNTVKNNLTRLNPFANYQANGLQVNIGLNLVQESGILKRTNLFPVVHAEFTIAPDYAVFFAGLNGDVQKTSLNEFSFENPYLGRSISIQNSVVKNHFFAGVKGNAGEVLGYKASVWMKRIQDLPLLVNSSSRLNRFEISYAQGISQLSGFDAQVDIKATDKLNISSKLQAINYKLENETKAWFKPSLRLESQLRAQVSQKINLSSSLVYQGETFGKGLNAEAISLDSFLDISVGAEYQVTKKWSAFAQANNLLNKAYQQYLYYPRLGLNFFGGLQYSF